MNTIVNYFNNHFSLTISLYLLLLVSVVTITTLLSKLCVILKEKAHLSDGVVAGLLLGVITSLPELVTCVSSIFISSSQPGSLAIGDIVGSNIFDIFILAVCLLVCIIVFINKKANQCNNLTLIFTGSGTIFILLAFIANEYIPSLIWHGFNFFTIGIFASYALSVFFMTRNAKVSTNVNEGMTEVKQAHQSCLFKLKLVWVCVLIAIVAITLIACSVFLTYTSESLIFYHWDSVFGSDKGAFGGALLLGVVTSLPEIICCINLCVCKEYNMVIDTIVGSTSFNLAVLSIANICYSCLNNQPEQGMFVFNTDNLAQVIICALMIILMICYLFVNSKNIKSKITKKQNIVINASLLSITIIIYFVFLILGFVC